MNKTGAELSILGDIPPSLSKEFNTSINDDNSIIQNTTTSNDIDNTRDKAVNNSIIDNNNNTAINGIDREEKVLQIVNNALEKARSRAEGDTTVNDTLESARSDNAMDNFITVTEIPTIPPKSPIIESSNLLVPPKSPNRIIQVNSNELPIIENGGGSNNLKSSTTADQTIDGSQINKGEINGDTTTIHIGKIGNPIGSLGTLWDSVATEQEMVNVNVNIGDNRGNGEYLFCLFVGIVFVRFAFLRAYWGGWGILCVIVIWD